MSILEFFFVLIIVFVFAIIVLAANYADRKRDSPMAWAVIGAVILLNALLVLNTGVTVANSTSGGAILDAGDPPGRTAAWTGFIISLIVAGLSTALLWRPVRERVAVLFPRYRGDADRSRAGDVSGTVDVELGRPKPQPSGEPLFPQMLNYFTTETKHALQHEATTASIAPAEADSDGVVNAAYYTRGFNPASYVHMLAVVLVLYLLGSQLIDFIISGGLEGLAQTYTEQGLNVWSLLSNSVPFIVLSFLGVGLGLRRDLRQSLERLGLGRINQEGVAVSIGVTFALFAGLFIVGVLWMQLVPEDVYEEQTQATEALSKSVTSIGLAVVLAASAAIGEEIAFRGALQPVIGFWPTAIVFAMTHTQYALTPAWLIILGVAVAFGWIRQRYNTSVAILTHFWYNLFQLLLLFVGPEEVTESFVHLLL